MLERRHRLTSSAGFTEATRRGRRAGTRTLVLHLTSSASAVDGDSGLATDARVGFVVSRAVGDAVTRNRVRRRLRHLARDRVRLLPARSVLVVRALPASAPASYADLARDLDATLRRLDGSTAVSA